MASVFQYTTKSGKKRYGVAYVRSDGERKYRRGFGSKREAQRWGEHTEVREREYRDGVRTRDIESHRAHQGTPIEVHIEAWLADCALSQSERHVKDKRRYLMKLRADAGILTFATLTYDRVANHLRKIKEARSPRTYNAARAQIVAFARWCEKSGRLREHDLDRIPRLDEVSGRVRPRRALTRVQITSLLVASPPYRRTVYLVAILTGLRRGELSGLLWDDLDLDHNIAMVRNTKAGRVDELPIHAQVVDVLKSIDRTGPRVFCKGIPKAEIFDGDLDQAGIRKWDDAGRVVDFHALRTTTGTMLARSGVSPQVCKRLMRHSSMEITLRYYTDLNIRDDAQALAGVAELGAQQKAQHFMPSHSASFAMGGSAPVAGPSTGRSDNPMQNKEVTDSTETISPDSGDPQDVPRWQAALLGDHARFAGHPDRQPLDSIAAGRRPAVSDVRTTSTVRTVPRVRTSAHATR